MTQMILVPAALLREVAWADNPVEVLSDEHIFWPDPIGPHYYQPYYSRPSNLNWSGEGGCAHNGCGGSQNNPIHYV